ncbi:hypothetical protein FAF44_31010 [Nonomuraea sp. MG754425]|uniref:helix-turn-helix domain-containing protein n=1 Tax=Nonomuraea sp. MG754425 TaxID=2570319 RepID=UPI001F161279|nr:MarR family transcriptional regulator [Nonomuraea sp. MG754425]MCF6472793.1 hypothetical protein [Nonomuraea sp. MG754425]
MNDRPIGYWLKHLDTLLEHAMDDVLPVSRREWQVLNATANGADPRALDAFDAIDEATRRLTERGWLAGGQLTDAGRAAHTEIAERVGAFRRRSMAGVTPQEYQATVGVLRRMAANLTSPG